MRDPRKKFSGSVMLVCGVLIAVAAAPAGRVVFADSEDAAATQAAAISAPDAAAAPLTGLLTGREVYDAVCVACHAAPGVGGAPALGDGEAWAARIAQGRDTLIDHSLNGFSSSTGLMPRKGGRVDLSDEEIIAAVEYMLEQVAH